MRDRNIPDELECLMSIIYAIRVAEWRAAQADFYKLLDMVENNKTEELTFFAPDGKHKIIVSIDVEEL